jgi:hypothetical protein
VLGSKRYRLKDEYVQRSLREFDALTAHGFPFCFDKT